MRGRLFSPRSIKNKLAVLTVSSVGLALLVCCIAFTVHGAVVLRRSMAEQYSALAEMLASNCTAALSFRQNDIARELMESLRSRPEIQSAYLLNNNGEVFAAYSRTGELHGSPLHMSDGHLFTDDGFLEIAVVVEEAGDRLGTMRLRVAMDNVRRQILLNIGTACSVLIVSLAAGYVLGIPMRRSISRPILDLAEIASQISRDSDYSRRVVRTTDDEIGELYEQFNGLLDCVSQRTRLLSSANEHLISEITARERTMKKLKETQSELMEVSRKAGMADIADSVLHNIGNVLNSINVSASQATDKIDQLRISGLTNSVALLERHRSDLASFFTMDEKGERLPGYLAKLAENLHREQQTVVQELKLLSKNVDHVKEIVRAQQSYASTGGVIDECDPVELMEDALRFFGGALPRHNIEVQSEFTDISGFQAEKAKVLQILVNLIKNAKEALTACDSIRRAITLRVCQRDGRVVFQVADNGVGIAADKLAKIFSHGFTTKRTGHGYGLHTSANAAAEMGGSLSVHSDGVGRGATFTLELPLSANRGGGAAESNSAVQPVFPAYASHPLEASPVADRTGRTTIA